MDGKDNMRNTGSDCGSCGRAGARVCALLALWVAALGPKAAAAADAGVSGLSAEPVGAMQADLAAVARVRDSQLRTLGAEYEAAEAKEPGLRFELFLTNAVLRNPAVFEVRRWGGQWLPGACALPWYHKSRNPVDASRLRFDGERLKGDLRVSIVSDGWVPSPGTTYELEFAVDAVVKDGRVAGTYRARGNPDMTRRAPANQVVYERTLRTKLARGSVGDLLKLIAWVQAPQVEHWDDLAGRVERFRVPAPPVPDLREERLVDADASALYAAAVRIERQADEAYRQIRACWFARMTSLPFETASEMAVERWPARPEFDPARAGAQAACMRERMGRLRAIAEAAEAQNAGEPLCPVGEVVTEDPLFRGYFSSGPLACDGGRTNFVPAVEAEGAEVWKHVSGWRVLGPFPEDRHRKLMTPLPELVPAFAAPCRMPSAAGAVEAGSIAATSGVTWCEVRKQPHAFADFGEALGEKRHVLCYAATELHSASDQEVWASVRPADWCRLWIDDRPVWANVYDQREASVVRIRLKKGVNRVLVRCANDTHEWGLALQVCVRGRPRTAAEVASATPVAAGPLKTAGWYGPGHVGVYPDAKPVTAWDLERGLNVHWRLPFSRKSIATPVIVGDRIFTPAEPHSLFCVDKRRGTVLWKRDSNVLEFISDPAERQQALADYEAEGGESVRRQRSAEEERLRLDLAAVGAKLELDQNNAELTARGETLSKQIEALQTREGRIGFWGRKVGVVIDPTGDQGWFGGYVGYTASTPVTDGEHVWVKHGTGVAACYDLEGSRKWMVRTHFEDKETTSMPSPMLAGDLLVIVGDAGWWRRNSKSARLPATEHGGQLGAWMIALDRTTGELRWDAGPIRHVKYGVCNTPYPMKLSNGRDAMWVIVTSTGQLLRGEDGRQLLDHMGVSACFHASPTFEGNRVYFSRGGHVDAVELLMQDRDTVGVRRLWTSGGGGNAGCVVYSNRVHCTAGASDRGAGGALAYCVKDAATGAGLAEISPCLPGDSGDSYVPPVFAGGYVYAFAGNACAVIEAGEAPRVLARMRNERMYAQPAFDGDRMYLRTYTSLMCIGRKGDEGAEFERLTQAAAIVDAFPSKIAKTGCAQVVSQENPVPRPRAIPAQRIVTGAMPREWLRAGSFILRPEQDPLAGLGGCAKAAPAEGDEATADGRTCRFERVPPGEVGPSGVAVRAADEGPMGTEQFYFTWLDNRAGSRCFRATLSGVADQAWIGGEPVEHFGLVSVRGCGVVPVLIRVRFPGDLPPFRRQGSFLFVLDEEADPDETFRAQVERIRRNESALRRVLELAPNTREATRAQYLLSFVPAP